MPKADLFVLGDSHAIAIVQAALDKGIAAVGGPLDIGRNLNREFFDISGTDFVFRDPAAQSRYTGFLKSLGAESLRDVEVPVVSTLGSNFHYLSRPEAWPDITLGEDRDKQFITRLAFEETIKHLVEGDITACRHLSAMGKTVFWPLPPRRTPLASHEIYLAIEELVPKLMKSCGAIIIDVRDVTLDAEGNYRPDFVPSAADKVHGNTLFGSTVVDRLRSFR